MSDAPLPRGRHNLGRDAVRAVQRTRILHALTTTMAVTGYADTPVSAVLTAAGVSRETFYELFASKADCFAAALDDTIRALTDTVADAVPHRPGGSAHDMLSDLVGAYLETLEAQPALARLFLIETYAAGPTAMQARLSSQRRVVAGIADLFGHDDAGDGYLRCEAYVGIVVAMVTARVIDPSLGTIIGLRPLLADVGRRLLS